MPPVASGSRQPQIQALRAVAVVSVITYHFWPSLLSGGYAGVDVFFVISGYLMTSSLLRLREQSQGRARATMRAFYTRRLARILPAALVTLLLTGLAIVLTVPEGLWGRQLKEILASALFVENWKLALGSADYLGSSSAGTIVQHFWSLSVEEQFYACWPLVVLFAAAAGPSVTARGRLVRLLACFGAVTAASFALSVHLTGQDRAMAYFDTRTRFWELSLGGVLLVLDRRLAASGRFRAAAGWVGLAVVLAALLSFDDHTAFPGWRAALPVGGTALVMLCSPAAASWGPGRFLAWPAAQTVGDLSYSLYLLHWPLLVLAGGAAVGPLDLGTTDKLLLLPLLLALAWAMKRWVEDPLRLTALPPRAARHASDVHRSRPWRRRTTVVVVGTQIAVAVLCFGGLTTEHFQLRRAQAASRAFRASPSAQAACFAAIARRTTSSSCPTVRGADVLGTVPAPPLARKDWPYGRCQHGASSGGVLRCDLVEGDGPLLVIAGDSHATQWIPAILPWAAAHHLSVTTFLRSGCPLADGRSWGHLCARWNDEVRATIKRLHPAYLMTSVQSANNAHQKAPQERDLAAGWLQLREAGTRLIAFRDIPQPRLAGIPDLATCVSAKRSFARCRFALAKGARGDLVVDVARRVGGVPVIDLTDWFCPGGQCRPQVNGILVWIDGSHMSSWFARGLSSEVSAQLERLT